MVGKCVSRVIDIELIVAALVAIAVVGVGLVGFKPFVVMSGSMEPVLKVGSLAYVNTRVSPGELEKGDIGTFSTEEGKTVTHRVVLVDSDAREFVTKGDANAQVDPAPVPFDRVVGKTVLGVPYAGMALDAFIANKVAWICVLVLFNAVLLALPRIFRKEAGPLR